MKTTKGVRREEDAGMRRTAKGGATVGTGAARAGGLAALVLVTVVVAGAVPGRAVAQLADTVTLTLEEALNIAGGTNPAYRQAVNSAQLNGTEMTTTWFDQVLPRANLELFQTSFNGNLTRVSRDVFGNPIENPISDWRYFSDTQQNMGLSWIIQGRSILHALDRQKLTNLDRDIAEERALSTMQITVRRDFMDALEQRELLRAEEELLEGRRLDQQVAERLFGLAMRTRVDVLNAELAVEQQALALQQQQAAFEQAKLTLRTSLGDDQLPAFRLAEVDVPVFDPSSLDADGLVAEAVDVNPELRQARVAVRASDVGLKDANRAWWPEFFFSFNLTRRAQSSDTEALFDTNFGSDLDQRFYIQMSVPMFNNFFGNKQAIAQARVDLQNSRESERETALRIEETVRSALLELQNQFESLRIADRAAEIAAEAIRLAREEYRLGAGTFESLRTAIDNEGDTRRQVIQARHSFADALLSLEEAVGAPVRPAGAAGGGR